MTQADPSKLRVSKSGQAISGSTDGVGVVVPAAGDSAGGGLVSIANGGVGITLDRMDWCEVFEDFLGYFTLADIDATFVSSLAPWVVESEAGTTPVFVKLANQDNGALDLRLLVNSETADLTLYWGDEINIDSDKGPVLVTRLQLPAVGLSTDSRAWGFIGAKGTDVDFDANNNNAIFKVDADNLTLLVESDDNTTNDDDNDTGVTLVAGTYYDFKVSMSPADGASATDVHFYYKLATSDDWIRLLETTTFAYGAAAQAQPGFNVEKSTGAGVPSMYIDMIHVYWNR